MHYSPVRRSSAGCKHPLLPLDLHVLSLPPAFNLSHDQTLQFKSYKNPKILYSCSRQNSISTSHCPDISYPKYLGQRPHELLGQLFKERLSCCSIKAAYSTSFRHLVNRLFFGVFRPRKATKNHPAYCLFRGAHSTVNCLPVNCFLKNFKTQFLQHFQAVALRIWSRLSGLPLEGDAHSTDLPGGVNGDSEKNSKSPKIGHAVIRTRAIFFLPAWITQSSPSTNIRSPSNC